MTDPTPKLYLVCYDIAEDRRRAKVLQLLRGYGEHLQYSVFRCRLSAARFEELLTRLSERIRPSEDQVLLVLLGKAESKKSWRATVLGRPLPPPRKEAVIV